MTDDPITLRNRANASKSTGPKTARGKAKVAGNARRHSATAKLDPASIAAWLSIILDRTDIGPSDVLPGTDRGFRALELARAEARVVACERALRSFEAGEVTFSDAREATKPPPRDMRIEGILLEMRTALLAEGLDRKGRAHLAGILGALEGLEGPRPRTSSRGDQLRLLVRYLAEARSKRRRAFRAWLDAMKDGAPTPKAV